MLACFQIWFILCHYSVTRPRGVLRRGPREGAVWLHCTTVCVCFCVSWFVSRKWSDISMEITIRNDFRDTNKTEKTVFHDPAFVIISFKLERYVGPLFIATLFQTYAIDFAQYKFSLCSSQVSNSVFYIYLCVCKLCSNCRVSENFCISCQRK